VDGLPIRCSCGLLGNAHQLCLRFAEEGLPAAGAIDPGVADHHKKILFGKDSCERVGYLVVASGTGERTGLALTERTCRIRASTQVKELEPGPAFFGQHMTRADPFHQFLSLEMGEIRTSGRRRIAKGLHQILRPYRLLGLHEEQRLMLIGFHPRSSESRSDSF